MSIEQADSDVPLLKKVKAINEFVDAGNNFLPATQQNETVSEIKKCIYNLLDVSSNSKKFDVLLNALIELTDETTYEDFTKFIKSHENKSVKIKMYQAVKFDGTKVKYLQAEDTDSLIKQFKFV